MADICLDMPSHKIFCYPVTFGQPCFDIEFLQSKSVMLARFIIINHVLILLLFILLSQLDPLKNGSFISLLVTLVRSRGMDTLSCPWTILISGSR